MRLTQERVIEKFKQTHGDKYDYSKVEFTKAHEKVLIICPLGHEFSMSPSNHYHSTHPQGCPICSGKGPGKDLGAIFIRKAREVFGDTYEYLSEYVDSKVPVLMRCTIHNIEVSQVPSGHLQSKTPCPECIKAKKLLSKPSPYNTTKANRGDFDFPSYIYLIRLTDDNEDFLKIGISKNVDVRIREFKTKGYSVDIQKTLYFESCNNAIILEQNILESFREYEYIPSTKFKGMYECLQLSELDRILTQLE